MVFGEEKAERILNLYLKEAERYIRLGVVKNPNLQDPKKLANYLMQEDGVDLSKIRTGDQKLPDNL